MYKQKERKTDQPTKQSIEVPIQSLIGPYNNQYCHTKGLIFPTSIQPKHPPHPGMYFPYYDQGI